MLANPIWRVRVLGKVARVGKGRRPEIGWGR